MTGARIRLLEYFKQHVGEWLSLTELSKVGEITDWPRVVRSLRQEGWKIERRGYGVNTERCLKSPTKGKGNKRCPISKKLRAQVLRRDNSTCVKCGKKPIEDNIKLEIDHIRPVEMGGKTELSNLQTLCSECNQGKKAFFSDFEKRPDVQEIIFAKTGAESIRIMAKNLVNIWLEPNYIGVLVKIRDWERTVRSLRQKGEINYKIDRKTKKYMFLKKE